MYLCWVFFLTCVFARKVDASIWKSNPARFFFVKSFYISLEDSSVVHPPRSRIWLGLSPPLGGNIYVRCKMENESSNHLFLHCDYS